MSRKIRKTDEQNIISGEIILLCAVFLLGALLGSLLASLVSFKGGVSGIWFNPAYVSEGGAAFKVFTISNLMLLLSIFLSAFIWRGQVLVPTAIFIKGFSIAIAVTSFIKVYGKGGYLPALFSCFLSSFIVMLAFILLSGRALDVAAQKKNPSARLNMGNDYLLSGAISLILVIIAGVIHCFIMPVFVRVFISFVG